MRFVPLAVLFLLVTSPSAFAQQYHWGRPHPPRAGACFYRDKDFRGDAFCMNDGERWPQLPHGFNDAISSIRVFGGTRLRVFRDGNFSGASLLVDHDLNNLHDVQLEPGKSWNDRISAIALFRDRDPFDRGPGGR